LLLLLYIFVLVFSILSVDNHLFNHRVRQVTIIMRFYV